MKGLFSLMVTIFCLALIAVLYLQASLVRFYGGKLAVENRVNTLLRFLRDLEIDGKEVLEIIGRRAMNSAINWVIDNGIPLTDAKSSLEELMLNGTLNQSFQKLMENATLPYWMERIKEVAKGLGLSVEFKNLNVSALPFDSFNLLVRARFSLKIYDLRGIANLSRNLTLEKLISIEGFEDPLYPLNTYGRVVNFFKKSPYLNNHTFVLPNGSISVENLREEAENSYYNPSLAGASFLDRLEGKYFVQAKYSKLSPFPIGLESFVNKEEISQAGLGVWVERSNLDWVYFSGLNHTSYKVQQMPESFRIDDLLTLNNLTHIEYYQVEDLIS